MAPRKKTALKSKPRKSVSVERRSIGKPLISGVQVQSKRLIAMQTAIVVTLSSVKPHRSAVASVKGKRKRERSAHWLMK